MVRVILLTGPFRLLKKSIVIDCKKQLELTKNNRPSLRTILDKSNDKIQL